MQVSPPSVLRRPCLLLFDYDGTLSPLVCHPDRAELSARTRQALTLLNTRPGTTVGVVSSRALSDLRRRVGLPLPVFAGSGGLEIETGGGLQLYPISVGYKLTLAAAANALADAVGRFPGTWVERKPATMSVHFRELPQATAPAFLASVADLLNGFPEFEFREVSDAIEVTPAGGWHKGTAVETATHYVRRTTGRNPLAVYFGDAANDEEAMTAVRAAGGLSVGVGPTPPAAEYHLPDPHAVTDWIEEVLRNG